MSKQKSIPDKPQDTDDLSHYTPEISNVDIQKKLNTIILSMSEKELDIVKIRQIMQDLYKNVYINDFRHSYAEFYRLLEKIDKDMVKNFEAALLPNLLLLKQEATNDNSPNFAQTKKSILKLCDSLTLEIYRFQANSRVKEAEDFQRQVELSEEKLKQAEQKLKEAEDKIARAEEQLTRVEKSFAKTDETLQKSQDLVETSTEKLNRIQGETVAIISIFAAIVLAFSGGLSYLSSAISAVHNSPITKLILTVLVCGFILFNTVFILVYVVARMLDKNIFLSCDDKTCKDCKLDKETENTGDKCENCKVQKKRARWLWFIKVKNCLPYIFAMDVVLLILIAAIIAFMFFQKTPICPDWLR